ncbi:MAG: hypothetical protein PWP65_1848 [Clostridia bacterium]|nr:hypothetical protein [Clostridia bacterium]
MAAVVDKELCTGCGTCAESCPNEAITVDDVAVIDEDACVECGVCVDECPNGAISLPD